MASIRKTKKEMAKAGDSVIRTIENMEKPIREDMYGRLSKEGRTVSKDFDYSKFMEKYADELRVIQENGRTLMDNLGLTQPDNEEYIKVLEEKVKKYEKETANTIRKSAGWGRASTVVDKKQRKSTILSNMRKKGKGEAVYDVEPSKLTQAWKKQTFKTK